MKLINCFYCGDKCDDNSRYARGTRDFCSDGCITQYDSAVNAAPYDGLQSTSAALTPPARTGRAPEEARKERPAEEALKYDDGKPALELIDSLAIEELGRVLAFGRKKYAAHNWRKGMGWSRPLGAILRHGFAILRGEDYDPESGLLHSAHIMTNAMFLTYYILKKVGTDDRYSGL